MGRGPSTSTRTGSRATYRSHLTRTPRASMSTWGRRGLSRAVRAPRTRTRRPRLPARQYDGLHLGVATEIDDVIPVSQLGDVTREDLTDDNRQAVCAVIAITVKTEAHTHRRESKAAAARRRSPGRRLPQSSRTPARCDDAVAHRHRPGRGVGDAPDRPRSARPSAA